MTRGILETIGLAGSVLFAAPVALFGLNHLAGGSVGQGVLFLVIAALMIVVPQHATTPGDVASEAAEDAVARAVKTDDDED